jgi:hypothetical protein
MNEGRMEAPPYDKSVFINCPFDRQYAKLFPALVFTVQDCGFIARSALETSDSGESRIEKLYRIILESQYGIHDLSRTELNKDRLPRFNMPLELGIFLGAKKFGSGKQKQKICLILDREKFRYQKFCSDLSGNDPMAHQNHPAAAVRLVRDWLQDTNQTTRFPGGDSIFRRYTLFEKDIPPLCASQRLRREDLTFNDLTFIIQRWLTAHPL